MTPEEQEKHIRDLAEDSRRCVITRFEQAERSDVGKPIAIARAILLSVIDVTELWAREAAKNK